MQVGPEETAVIERIVMKEGGLPAELAPIIVQMAKTQNQLLGLRSDAGIPAHGPLATKS